MIEMLVELRQLRMRWIKWEGNENFSRILIKKCHSIQSKALERSSFIAMFVNSIRSMDNLKDEF